MSEATGPYIVQKKFILEVAGMKGIIIIYTPNIFI
jgi:hypothetical protein